MERTPAIWKRPGGVYARITTTSNWNEGINKAPEVKMNKWVYMTYMKKGSQLKMYYDGKVVGKETLSGKSKSNTGPLYIGKDPWYSGVTGAGFDNIQIHNRALTHDEIRHITYGQILFNDNLVLALDFSSSVTSGKVKDLSSYGHDVKVVGGLKMLSGGPPQKPDYYMSFDGVSDYLVIPHTQALALGKDNGNFTVSFALLQTQNQTYEFGEKILIHKGRDIMERTPAIWK